MQLAQSWSSSFFFRRRLTKKKMNTAKRGTARYVETPNLKEAEDNIRKTGRAWKDETK